MKKTRHLLIFGLLCLAYTVHAQVAPDAKELARQIVAGVNDNATTLVERQAALTKLQESAQLFIDSGEKLEAAQVLNRVGRLHLLLNSPQNAITSHSQALALLKQTPSIEVEVDNLNGLAAAYMLLDKSRVYEFVNRALMLSEQSGYTLGNAQALLMLSNRQNFEDHQLALQTAQASLALWNTTGDKQGTARAYEQVGTCYMAQNFLSEATQNYEQALQIWRELNNSPGQAGALINLGFIDYRKAEWQSSIQRYIQAQPLIDEAAEPEKMGQIASGLAEVFNAHGLYEEGLVHFNRALAYYRRFQDPHAIWYATWALGYTYYLQQDYAAALSHFEESLAGVVSDGLEAAASHEGIGRVRLALGEYSSARQSLEFSLNIFLRAANWMEAARTQGLIGQVLEYEGQLAGARRNYQNALKTFERLSDPVNAAAVYYALGRLELRRKQYERAEEYLSRSLRITESMHRVADSRDLTVAFSASVHDRYQTYIECLMNQHQLSPSQGLDVRAFETSESARARALVEFLRATNTNFAPGLDPGLAQQEKSLRQSLRQRAEYRTQLLSSSGRSSQTEELKALDAELSSLEAEYDQIIATINTRYPDYEQITRPANWNLQRIQQEVIENDQTVLLEYSLGADKSYAWAITRNDIKTFELPGQAQITEAAKKLYDLLVHPPDAATEDKLDRASRELSDLILSPVADHLNKQMIIVVADGALNYIPFQILRAPSSPAEPLVAKHNIVNAPSASVLGDLRQEASLRQPATKLLAAFGDPIFHSSYAKHKDQDSGNQLAMQNPDVARWRSALRDIELNRDVFDPSVIPRLFYAARELTNLRQLARGQALVLMDVAATRERFLTTDLTKYSILHLATHGFLDPKRPESSGLLLSTTDSSGQEINGFIGLQEIYNLRAPVFLVVLSACQTALGKDVRGEGLVGLTRGFMYAGASSVVASLWKVDDAATAELMKHFYTNMLQHQMQPAEALRAAQNSIRQDPRWRSPYFWGAFTLQGEYRQVIKPIGQDGAMSLRLQVSIVLAILLLLAFPIWLYLSRNRARTINPVNHLLIL